MTKEQETWKRGCEAGHQDGYDAGYVAAKREIGFDAARGAVIHAADGKFYKFVEVKMNE